MAINLLPQKELSLTNKLLSWILTYGRFIIVGTELVVLLAFASRFKFDRDLVDLHDEIKQEEVIVKSLTDVETQSRSLQKRLEEIAAINHKGQDVITILLGIPSLVPANVFLDSLTIQAETLRLEGRASSGGAVSGFIKKLRSVPYISAVSLDRVTRDESLGGQIKFNATVTLTYANFNQ